MPVEIERKFLVEGDRWRREVRDSRRMRQGYLGGSRCSVRLRISGDQARLNIKSLELGRRRLEYEYAVPVAEADEMLEHLAEGPLVDKTRHRVPFGGMLWEVDEFHGANEGLIVAEIELESEEQRFERPDWLGREVTDEERYYNIRLASHPYREWSS